MKIFCLGLAACVVLFAGWTPAQTIETDSDKDFDLSRLKTFDFSDRVSQADRDLNTRRMREAIASELTANGYANSSDAGTPDFLIGCRFVENPVRRARVQYTEARMVVAFLNPSNKGMVWKAIATDIIDMSETEKMIKKSAEKLVKKFLKDARQKKD